MILCIGALKCCKFVPQRELLPAAGQQQLSWEEELARLIINLGARPTGPTSTGVDRRGPVATERDS